MSGRLKITEIFHSIQGESTFAGERFSFVRLTGCPLRCTWCDTTYSFTGGEWKTVEEIIAAVVSHGTKYVCVTGGEPLAQASCLELVKALRSIGLTVTIETSGEKDVGPYVPHSRLIMDIKAPGSGEVAKIAFENLAKLKPEDEIKFVLKDRADYDWALSVCEKHALTRKHKVLFSPVAGDLNLKDLAEWMLDDRIDARLQTQLHKLIWGQDSKGV